MSKELYFTRAGADRIMQRKQALFDELRLVQGQKSNAAEVGGDQWHDNFSFEQLMVAEERINRQIMELNVVLKKMIVIEKSPPLNTNKLRIGHVAVIEMDGECKTFLIGGYEDFDSKTSPPTISYLAPLVCQFIGKEVDSVAIVSISGKKKKLILKQIKLLQIMEE